MKTAVSVGSVTIGGGAPLVFIGGPCALESESLALEIAHEINALCVALGIPYIFKGSYDKANRSSPSSYRGPGLDKGLDILRTVVEQLGVPVTTDVHEPWQCEQVAKVVDLLQIPAFLFRQTDLLIAAARTKQPVNVKKAQFAAPWDMRNIVAKLKQEEASGILFTERGTMHGYGDLVVDFRGLAQMRELAPVVFDATHSVQQPGALGERSGGQRQFVPLLARAAVAVGTDALFMEVHPNPDRALSDGPNMVPLAQLGALLTEVKELESARAQHVVLNPYLTTG